MSPVENVAPLRIAQWTTGNVARETVKAVLSRPDLELVGAFAHSPEKVGVDVGTLCGLDELLGVAATGDVDELLCGRLDCVIFTPLHFDVAAVTQILRAGVNIVTSAEFLTGVTLPEADRTAVSDAARDGGATIFGSGINPGFMHMLTAIASGMSTRVTRAAVIESVDVAQFLGDANFQSVGWGRPKGDPGHADDVRKGTAVFVEAVDAFARLMRIELDDITCSVDFAYATEDFVADGVAIAAGHVAGMDVRWHGVVDGIEVVALNQLWTATSKLDPPWTADEGYRLEVIGDPSVHVKVDFMPTPEDLANLTPGVMRSIGLRITAAPLVNANPAVCAAAPGIDNYADLHDVTARLLPEA